MRLRKAGAVSPTDAIIAPELQPIRYPFSRRLTPIHRPLMDPHSLAALVITPRRDPNALAVLDPTPGDLQHGVVQNMRRAGAEAVAA